MSQRGIDRLLRPRSVVVVGASARPGRIGTVLWRALLAGGSHGGFDGELRGVNLRHPRIEGRRLVRHVGSLRRPAELALICTPPATVAGLVAELAAAGTAVAVVLTEGLEAAQVEAARAAARAQGMRLLGPGSFGIVQPAIGLQAGLATAAVRPGGAALVAQDGATLAALLDRAQARGLGFSHVVGLGAQADIDAADLLDALAHDGATRVVLLSLAGIPAGAKFLSAARAAAQHKPVLVHWAGPVEDAAEAFAAAVSRVGLRQAATAALLLDAAALWLHLDPARDGRLQGIGNDPTAHWPWQRRVRAAPGSADVAPSVPPIVLPAHAPPEAWAAALAQALTAPGAATVTLQLVPSALVPAEAVARACAEAVRGAPGRVLAQVPGGADGAAAREVLVEAGALAVESAETVARAWPLVVPTTSSPWLGVAAAADRDEPRDADDGRDAGDRAKARAIAEVALATGRGRLDEASARALLAAAGLQGCVSGPGSAPASRAPAFCVGADIDDVFGPVLWCAPGGLLDGWFGQRLVLLPPLGRGPLRVALAASPLASHLGGRPGRPGPLADALGRALEAVAWLLAELPALAAIGIELCVDATGALVVAGAQVRLDPRRPGGAARFAIAPCPVELTETFAWQGETIRLRPIRADDVAQHREFLARLRPEDMRLRFFNLRRALSAAELARLTQIDHAREIALIAERRREGPDGAGAGHETLGVVRAVTDPDHAEAEFAIVVRSDLKGRGLGRLLMRKLIDTLGRRGVGRLVGHVLRENTAMHGLLGSLGFHPDPSRADADSHCFVRPLAGFEDAVQPVTLP